MISQISPTLHKASVEVRPSDLLLQKGSWVRFSSMFPGSHKWAGGKTFEVSQEPIIVPYLLSYIIPEDDYKDVDLSNSTTGEKLYPESENVLYQIAVGFKPGDYLVHLYVPKDTYVYPLGDSSMYPDVSHVKKRYLGAKTHRESPDTAPLLNLYAIKDMPAFFMRFYTIADAVAFEKCTAQLYINKCKLTEIEGPMEEQEARALLIPWYEEMKGF